jgi:hypothetical protein
MSWPAFSELREMQDGVTDLCWSLEMWAVVWVVYPPLEEHVVLVER